MRLFLLNMCFVTFTLTSAFGLITPAISSTSQKSFAFSTLICSLRMEGGAATTWRKGKASAEIWEWILWLQARAREWMWRGRLAKRRESSLRVFLWWNSRRRWRMWSKTGRLQAPSTTNTAVSICLRGKRMCSLILIFTDCSFSQLSSRLRLPTNLLSGPSCRCTGMTLKAALAVLPSINPFIFQLISLQTYICSKYSLGMSLSNSFKCACVRLFKCFLRKNLDQFIYLYFLRFKFFKMRNFYFTDSREAIESLRVAICQSILSSIFWQVAVSSSNLLLFSRSQRMAMRGWWGWSGWQFLHERRTLLVVLDMWVQEEEQVWQGGSCWRMKLQSFITLLLLYCSSSFTNISSSTRPSLPNSPCFDWAYYGPSFGASSSRGQGKEGAQFLFKLSLRQRI